MFVDVKDQLRCQNMSKDSLAMEQNHEVFCVRCHMKVVREAPPLWLDILLMFAQRGAL